MAWLLIDNSNTRTKFALGCADGLGVWRGILATEDVDAAALEGLLAGVVFDAVVCASVVPEKARVLRDFFSANKLFHEFTCRSEHGMGFELEHPEQVGNDRLANAMGLLGEYGGAGIAVDFGTAVTFSVVSEGGNFCGGMIAPGMAAMMEALVGRTAQLPRIELREPVCAVGRTTEEAMLAGAVTGQRGMVGEILRALIGEMGGRPRVVATGGGAVFGARGVSEIDVVDADLTLKGIQFLAAKIFPESGGR